VLLAATSPPVESLLLALFCRSLYRQTRITVAVNAFLVC